MFVLRWPCAVEGTLNSRTYVLYRFVTPPPPPFPSPFLVCEKLKLLPTVSILRLTSLMVASTFAIRRGS